MSRTVYLLGAGVNRDLSIGSKGLQPPLDTDFFVQLAKQGEALAGEAIPSGLSVPHYRTRLGDAVPPLDQASEAGNGNICWVYDFIARF